MLSFLIVCPYECFAQDFPLPIQMPSVFLLLQPSLLECFTICVKLVLNSLCANIFCLYVSVYCSAICFQYLVESECFYVI